MSIYSQKKRCQEDLLGLANLSNYGKIFKKLVFRGGAAWEAL
jgi:hypothetical protein